MRKAFTSLVFDTPNLEHLELKSKNMCKVDVCVYEECTGLLYSMVDCYALLYGIYDQRHSGRHGVYVCDNFNVYYNGRKVADASVNTFMELGRSYAKDAFNVYYKGRKISNASPNTFQVLRNGYAKDAFNAYYRGREINNAYVNTFEVLGVGYAHDTFNTYYNGKKID